MVRSFGLILLGLILLVIALLMRGFWLLVIGLALLLIVLTWQQREQCPTPDEIWVMSDRGWVCVRKSAVEIERKES